MKRAVTTIMAVIMTASLVCTNAFALNPTSNFTKQKDYPGFKDVSTKASYYNAVKTCYEDALIAGTSDTAFSPNAKMTIADAAEFADMINATYYNDMENLIQKETSDTSGNAYIEYAVSSGILPKFVSENGNVSAPVSRFLFDMMMYSTVYPSEWKSINKIATNGIPDMKSADTTSGWAYKFYQNGIRSGDKNHMYDPNAPVSRAEACVVAQRIFDASKRLHFTIAKASTYNGGYSKAGEYASVYAAVSEYLSGISGYKSVTIQNTQDSSDRSVCVVSVRFYLKNGDDFEVPIVLYRQSVGSYVVFCMENA